MRVEYDHQIFSLQRRGGVSRYFTELIRAFDGDRTLGVEPALSFRFTANDHLLEIDHSTVRRSGISAIDSRATAMLALNRMVPRRVGGDLVHRTFYSSARGPRNGIPSVCTVYDMIPELFPEMFPGERPHQDKKAVVMASDAVLCISETTRRDLIRCYGELDIPVVVTHLAVSDEFSADMGVLDPRRRGGHVLFVGKRGGYKNFRVLLEAFAIAAPTLSDVDLLCIGGGAFTDDELADITATGLGNRVRQKYVEDAELPRAYSDALCFVFPSTYEGFGLPVVEAMAARCPVIIADTACLVEVAGEAAATFPPSDPLTLAGLLERIADDPTWRAELRTAGVQRSRQFTWHRTAENTAALYREVIGARAPR